MTQAILVQQAIIPAAAFVVALLAISAYRNLSLARGLVLGTDINKQDRRALPEGAGIALLAPLWIGGLLVMAMGTPAITVVAFLLLVTAFAAIGFFDDTKQKFAGRAGRTAGWLFRAAPAVVVALVFSFLHAPQPLVLWLVPVALFIAGAAGFQNTFAGLNGWEVGSGFIISVAVLYVLRYTALMPLAAVLCACALALLFWNRYPARVFPGDAGTLLIGSGIAGLMVLNGSIPMMLLTSLFFIPHIFDLLLKAVTNPGDMSQAKAEPYMLLPDGRLAVPEPEAAAGAGAKPAAVMWAGWRATYDFAKFLLRVFGPMREWQVVLLIWAIVAVNCAAVMALFGAL